MFEKIVFGHTEIKLLCGKLSMGKEGKLIVSGRN